MVDDTYLTRLAIVVLQQAFGEEGGAYAYTYGGQLWLDYLGVSPDNAARLAGANKPLANPADAMLAALTR